MKKLLSFIIIFIFAFAFIACDEVEKVFKLEVSDVTLAVGDKYEIKVKVSGYTGEIEYNVSDSSILGINENWIDAKAEGFAHVEISLKDEDVDSLKLNVIVVDNKEEKKSIKLSFESEIRVSETKNLKVELNNLDGEIEYISSNPDVLTVIDGKVTGVSAGTATVTAKLNDYYDIIEIEVLPPLVISPESVSVGKSSYELLINDEVSLQYSVLPSEANQEVVIKSEDETIVKVEGDKIIALSSGTTNVVITSKDDENVKAVIPVTVTLPLATRIDVLDNVILFKQDVGDTVQLEWKVVPENAKQQVVFASSDESVATVSADGLVSVVGSGSAIISILTTDESNVKKEVKFMVSDSVAPEFVLDDKTKEHVVLNWNKEFNPLEGIKAIDDVDGDITDSIKVETDLDNKTYGTYSVNYSVKDKAGNTAKMTRTVEVVWNYDVEFIGHAGSYYGLMNSEEAILYAVKNLKYQAVEVDLKQSKDGVFILSHDDTFNGVDLASTNWADLKDITRTAGRTGGIPSQNGSVVNSPYTTKLCTLERYLEICKEYNVKAVIELKWSNGISNNDTSRMDDLMKVIEACGMRENTIFLASQYNCLIWTRNNGYSDIECQYLVNSCESDTVLNRCKEYDFTVSINVTGTATNSDEWLAKYQEAGIKISTYTYTQYVDYDVVQKWIDKGVNYVTCDWHLMDKLNLPESSNDPDVNTTYNVIFKDYDGKVLKEAVVKKGRTAAPPTDPTRLGYEFTGWDKDIKNVKEDMEVTATYEIINYTINYESNIGVTSVSEWASKEEFANELYNDLFDWIVANESKITGLTKSGNTYTFTKNGKTVTFSSGSDIFKTDISTFELTFSNLFYKPVVRSSDGSCVIEPSEDYFINSDKYREKYKDLDALLMRGINNRYTSYDDTYTPTSAGKIQIFFRFHQWVTGGATINEFLPLPKKYSVDTSGYEVTLPTANLYYTINDEFDLPQASCASLEFLGWYLDKEFTKQVTKIEKGSTGNLILYAKWNINN